MGFILDGLDTESYDRSYSDRYLISRLVGYFRPYTRQMLLVGLMLALNSLAGTGGPIIAGLAFAIAWTPCVGPTLASILAAASTADSVAKGGVLLAFYSLGLAVPFLLTAVAFDKMTGAWSWLRDHYLTVTFISGAILIVMGTMILMNSWRSDAPSSLAASVTSAGTPLMAALSTTIAKPVWSQMRITIMR